MKSYKYFEFRVHKIYDRLDVGYKKKRGGKFAVMALGLTHCKVGKTADETDLRG